MKQPQPNGAPVKLKNGHSVELKVCSCCKDDYRYKRRFFVRDKQGKLLRMASTWKGAQQ